MTDKSYLTYLYLYAAYDKPKVVKLVKNRCIPMEFDLLDKTVASWEKATNTLRRIEKQESGIVDNAELFDISSGLIEGIKLNPAITNTFSKDNIDFKMVEIDKLIAVQRQVLLDFVDELTKKIPRNPSEDDLLKFCLIPEHIAPQPKISRRGSDSMHFASPSGDFRFLGGYLKKRAYRRRY